MAATAYQNARTEFEKIMRSSKLMPSGPEGIVTELAGDASDLTLETTPNDSKRALKTTPLDPLIGINWYDECNGLIKKDILDGKGKNNQAQATAWLYLILGTSGRLSKKELSQLISDYKTAYGIKALVEFLSNAAKANAIDANHCMVLATLLLKMNRKRNQVISFESDSHYEEKKQTIELKGQTELFALLLKGNLADEDTKNLVKEIFKETILVRGKRVKFNTHQIQSLLENLHEQAPKPIENIFNELMEEGNGSFHYAPQYIAMLVKKNNITELEVFLKKNIPLSYDLLGIICANVEPVTISSWINALSLYKEHPEDTRLQERIDTRIYYLSNILATHLIKAELEPHQLEEVLELCTKQEDLIVSFSLPILKSNNQDLKVEVLKKIISKEEWVESENIKQIISSLFESMLNEVKAKEGTDSYSKSCNQLAELLSIYEGQSSQRRTQIITLFSELYVSKNKAQLPTHFITNFVVLTQERLIDFILKTPRLEYADIQQLLESLGDSKIKDVVKVILERAAGEKYNVNNIDLVLTYVAHKLKETYDSTNKRQVQYQSSSRSQEDINALQEGFVKYEYTRNTFSKNEVSVDFEHGANILTPELALKMLSNPEVFFTLAQYKSSSTYASRSKRLLPVIEFLALKYAAKEDVIAVYDAELQKDLTYLVSKLIVGYQNHPERIMVILNTLHDSKFRGSLSPNATRLVNAIEEKFNRLLLVKNGLFPEHTPYEHSKHFQTLSQTIQTVNHSRNQYLLHPACAELALITAERHWYNESAEYLASAILTIPDLFNDYDIRNKLNIDQVCQILKYSLSEERKINWSFFGQYFKALDEEQVIKGLNTLIDNADRSRLKNAYQNRLVRFIFDVLREGKHKQLYTKVDDSSLVKLIQMGISFYDEKITFVKGVLADISSQEVVDHNKIRLVINQYLEYIERNDKSTQKQSDEIYLALKVSPDILANLATSLDLNSELDRCQFKSIVDSVEKKPIAEQNTFWTQFFKNSQTHIYLGMRFWRDAILKGLTQSKIIAMENGGDKEILSNLMASALLIVTGDCEALEKSSEEPYSYHRMDIYSKVNWVLDFIKKINNENSQGLSSIIDESLALKINQLLPFLDQDQFQKLIAHLPKSSLEKVFSYNLPLLFQNQIKGWFQSNSDFLSKLPRANVEIIVNSLDKKLEFSRALLIQRKDLDVARNVEIAFANVLGISELMSTDLLQPSKIIVSLIKGIDDLSDIKIDDVLSKVPNKKLEALLLLSRDDFYQSKIQDDPELMILNELLSLGGDAEVVNFALSRVNPENQKTLVDAVIKFNLSEASACKMWLEQTWLVDEVKAADFTALIYIFNTVSDHSLSHLMHQMFSFDSTLESYDRTRLLNRFYASLNLINWDQFRIDKNSPLYEILQNLLSDPHAIEQYRLEDKTIQGILKQFDSSKINQIAMAHQHQLQQNRYFLSALSPLNEYAFQQILSPELWRIMDTLIHFDNQSSRRFKIEGAISEITQSEEGLAEKVRLLFSELESLKHDVATLYEDKSSFFDKAKNISNRVNAYTLDLVSSLVKLVKQFDPELDINRLLETDAFSDTNLIQKFVQGEKLTAEQLYSLVSMLNNVYKEKIDPKDTRNQAKLILNMLSAGIKLSQASASLNAFVENQEIPFPMPTHSGFSMPDALSTIRISLRHELFSMIAVVYNEIKSNKLDLRHIDLFMAEDKESTQAIDTFKNAVQSLSRDFASMQRVHQSILENKTSIFSSQMGNENGKVSQYVKSIEELISTSKNQYLEVYKNLLPVLELLKQAPNLLDEFDTERLVRELENQVLSEHSHSILEQIHIRLGQLPITNETKLLKETIYSLHNCFMVHKELSGRLAAFQSKWRNLHQDRPDSDVRNVILGDRYSGITQTQSFMYRDSEPNLHSTGFQVFHRNGYHLGEKGHDLLKAYSMAESHFAQTCQGERRFQSLLRGVIAEQNIKIATAFFLPDINPFDSWDEFYSGLTVDLIGTNDVYEINRQLAKKSSELKPSIEIVSRIFESVYRTDRGTSVLGLLTALDLSISISHSLDELGDCIEQCKRYGLSHLANLFSMYKQASESEIPVLQLSNQLFESQATANLDFETLKQEADVFFDKSHDLLLQRIALLENTLLSPQRYAKNFSYEEISTFLSETKYIFGLRNGVQLINTMTSDQKAQVIENYTQAILSLQEKNLDHNAIIALNDKLSSLVDTLLKSPPSQSHAVLKSSQISQSSFDYLAQLSISNLGRFQEFDITLVDSLEELPQPNASIYRVCLVRSTGDFYLYYNQDGLASRVKLDLSKPWLNHQEIAEKVADILTLYSNAESFAQAIQPSLEDTQIFFSKKRPDLTSSTVPCKYIYKVEDKIYYEVHYSTDTSIKLCLSDEATKIDQKNDDSKLQDLLGSIVFPEEDSVETRVPSSNISEFLSFTEHQYLQYKLTGILNEEFLFAYNSAHQEIFDALLIHCGDESQVHRHQGQFFIETLIKSNIDSEEFLPKEILHRIDKQAAQYLMGSSSILVKKMAAQQLQFHQQIDDLYKQIQDVKKNIIALEKNERQDQVQIRELKHKLTILEESLEEKYEELTHQGIWVQRILEDPLAIAQLHSKDVLFLTNHYRYVSKKLTSKEYTDLQRSRSETKNLIQEKTQAIQHIQRKLTAGVGRTEFEDLNQQLRSLESEKSDLLMKIHRLDSMISKTLKFKVDHVIRELVVRLQEGIEQGLESEDSQQRLVAQKADGVVNAFLSEQLADDEDNPVLSYFRKKIFEPMHHAFVEEKGDLEREQSTWFKLIERLPHDTFVQKEQSRKTHQFHQLKLGTSIYVRLDASDTSQHYIPIARLGADNQLLAINYPGYILAQKPDKALKNPGLYVFKDQDDIKVNFVYSESFIQTFSLSEMAKRVASEYQDREFQALLDQILWPSGDVNNASPALINAIVRYSDLSLDNLTVGRLLFNEKKQFIGSLDKDEFSTRLKRDNVFSKYTSFKLLLNTPLDVLKRMKTSHLLAHDVLQEKLLSDFYRSLHEPENSIDSEKVTYIKQLFIKALTQNVYQLGYQSIQTLVQHHQTVDLQTLLKFWLKAAASNDSSSSHARENAKFLVRSMLQSEKHASVLLQDPKALFNTFERLQLTHLEVTDWLGENFASSHIDTIRQLLYAYDAIHHQQEWQKLSGPRKLYELYLEEKNEQDSSIPNTFHKHVQLFNPHGLPESILKRLPAEVACELLFTPHLYPTLSSAEWKILVQDINNHPDINEKSPETKVIHHFVKHYSQHLYYEEGFKGLFDSFDNFLKLCAQADEQTRGLIVSQIVSNPEIAQILARNVKTFGLWQKFKNDTGFLGKLLKIIDSSIKSDDLIPLFDSDNHGLLVNAIREFLKSPSSEDSALILAHVLMSVLSHDYLKSSQQDKLPLQLLAQLAEHPEFQGLHSKYPLFASLYETIILVAAQRADTRIFYTPSGTGGDLFDSERASKGVNLSLGESIEQRHLRPKMIDCFLYHADLRKNSVQMRDVQQLVHDYYASYLDGDKKTADDALASTLNLLAKPDVQADVKKVIFESFLDERFDKLTGPKTLKALLEYTQTLSLLELSAVLPKLRHRLYEYVHGLNQWGSQSMIPKERQKQVESLLASLATSILKGNFFDQQCTQKMHNMFIEVLLSDMPTIQKWNYDLVDLLINTKGAPLRIAHILGHSARGVQDYQEGKLSENEQRAAALSFKLSQYARESNQQIGQKIKVKIQQALDFFAGRSVNQDIRDALKTTTESDEFKTLRRACEEYRFERKIRQSNWKTYRRFRTYNGYGKVKSFFYAVGSWFGATEPEEPRYYGQKFFTASQWEDMISTKGHQDDLSPSKKATIHRLVKEEQASAVVDKKQSIAQARKALVFFKAQNKPNKEQYQALWETLTPLLKYNNDVMPIKEQMFYRKQFHHLALELKSHLVSLSASQKLDWSPSEALSELDARAQQNIDTLIRLYSSARDNQRMHLQSLSMAIKAWPEKVSYRQQLSELVEIIKRNAQDDTVLEELLSDNRLLIEENEAQLLAQDFKAIQEMMSQGFQTQTRSNHGGSTELQFGGTAGLQYGGTGELQYVNKMVDFYGRLQSKVALLQLARDEHREVDTGARPLNQGELLLSDAAKDVYRELSKTLTSPIDERGTTWYQFIEQKVNEKHIHDLRIDLGRIMGALGQNSDIGATAMAEQLSMDTKEFNDLLTKIIEAEATGKLEVNEWSLSALQKYLRASDTEAEIQPIHMSANTRIH